MKRASIITLLFIFMAAFMVMGCKPKEEAPAPAPVEKPAAPEAAPAPAAYKVGAIFAVTGPASSLGLPEKQTVEMLVEKINQKGGVNGHPLQVIIYDDEGDETKTVTYTKRLIANDMVKAIIGPTTSGTSFAILDTINNTQIPLISCAASYKIVTDENGQARKWIFKTPQSDSMAVERIYDYFNKHQISKIAIMTVSNGYGDSGRGELLRLAPNFNITITADERFGQDDVDMKAQLTKIKGTDAQAIVVWSIQKAPAVVVQNAKELGLTLLIVQSHGVASKKFIELCGDAADGQILPAGRLIVADQLPDSDPQKAMLVTYKNEFESRFGPVSTFGGHAYDALTILVKAMEMAGTDDPAKVRDALEQVHGFVGTGGIFNMSAADHNGLTKDAFVMIKIENKDWKLSSE
ncbi:MAG TPA: ABC transporter substrate-binding protein [bacterium]|nr:ABC transporter substrate-binding protein [bacterium]